MILFKDTKNKTKLKMK